MIAWRIREARNGDAERLIALVSRCRPDPAASVFEVDRDSPELRAIASFYGIQRGGFWVAEIDRGALIGSVGLLPARGANGLEIQKLQVDPAWRNRGVAEALFDHVRSVAEREGVDFLESWLDATDPNAIRFHEERGFVRVDPSRSLRAEDDGQEVHHRLELATHPS